MKNEAAINALIEAWKAFEDARKKFQNDTGATILYSESFCHVYKLPHLVEKELISVIPFKNAEYPYRAEVVIDGVKFYSVHKSREEIYGEEDKCREQRLAVTS